MKKSIFALLAAAAALCLLAGCNGNKAGDDRGATPDSLSVMADSAAMIQGYLTGQQLGQQFMMSAMQGMPIDTAQFLKGFKKGVADTTKFSYMLGQFQGVQTAMGLAQEKIDAKLFTQFLEYALQGDTTKLAMSQEEAYDYMRRFYDIKREAEAREQYGKNIEAGRQAIEDFAKQDDVLKTESGIAYRYATRGTGKTPTLDDKVKVTYRGTLIDGTEFDKSEEPVEFSPTQVIPGWTELLQLMKEGDQIIAYIPQEMAYGAKGSGGTIEPFSTLIFDITLLEVIPGEPAK